VTFARVTSPNHGLSPVKSRERNTEQLEERTRDLCERLGIKSARVKVRKAKPAELAELKARAARKRPQPLEADDDAEAA
jgi:hypothetical protein